jgi:subtilisin family serine protease
LSLMEDFTEEHIKPLKLLNLQSLPDHRSRKIKIAVIDSGVKKNDPRIRGARKAHVGKIKGCRNFVTLDPEDWDDSFGHGTLVSLLLMQVAPEVEIFVAKVSNGQYIEKGNLHCIARVGDTIPK